MTPIVNYSISPNPSTLIKPPTTFVPMHGWSGHSCFCVRVCCCRVFTLKRCSTVILSLFIWSSSDYPQCLCRAFRLQPLWWGWLSTSNAISIRQRQQTRRIWPFDMEMEAVCFLWLISFSSLYLRRLYWNDRKLSLVYLRSTSIQTNSLLYCR